MTTAACAKIELKCVQSLLKRKFATFILHTRVYGWGIKCIATRYENSNRDDLNSDEGIFLQMVRLNIPLPLCKFFLQQFEIIAEVWLKLWKL